MTYYGPKEMAAAFRTVRNNTIRIAEEIPEQNYSYRVTPDSRTVAETLVHIAAGTRFPERVHIVERRATMQGIDFGAVMAELAAEVSKPRSKAEIVELLRTEGEKFAHALEGIPEDSLAERVTLMPQAGVPDKYRFEMLLSPKEHEMHHRAQLMVVQRLLGIKPHLTAQMEQRAAAMKAAH